MPVFFFHLRESGTRTTDDEGLDLFDLESARAVAIRSARDVMSTEIKRGELHLDSCIDIVDDDGKTIDRIMFRDAVSVSG